MVRAVRGGRHAVATGVNCRRTGLDGIHFPTAVTGVTSASERSGKLSNPLEKIAIPVILLSSKGHSANVGGQSIGPYRAAEAVTRVKSARKGRA
jgi:hypothetical protein